MPADLGGAGLGRPPRLGATPTGDGRGGARLSRRRRSSAPAAGGAATPGVRCRPGRPGRTRPRRRGRTPPRRACSPRGHSAVPGSRSGKCWMIRARSTWARPKRPHAGGVDHPAAAIREPQRDGRAGGVPTATGEVVDHAGRSQGVGDQAVDEGGLAHAGVPDEDADPVDQLLLQGLEALEARLAGGGDDASDVERCVVGHERVGVGEVGLGEHEQGIHPGVVGRHQAPVDHPRTGLGVGQGGDDDELVGIGDDDPLDRVGVVGRAAQRRAPRSEADHPGQAVGVAGGVADELDVVADDDALAARAHGPSSR